MKTGFVTIKDIAREAGVSVASVSLAFSGSKRVSEVTRRRIMQIAKRYNYHINVLARNFSRGSSGMVSIILPQIPHIFLDPFFSQALSGCYDGADKFSYRLMLNIASKEFCARKEYLRILFSKEAACELYIGSTLNDRYLEDFAGSGLPFMLVGSYFDDMDIPYVIADNRAGGKILAQHLISHGIKKPVCVFGHFEVVSQRDRFAGVVDGLKSGGVDFNKKNLFITDFTQKAGYEITEKLLELKPDCIICGNDMIAYGVIERLKEKKLIPGRDILITGFDNTGLPLHNSLKLTTVNYPVYDMSFRAIERLIDSIENNKKLSKAEILPVELIKGNTCGC